MEMSACLVLVEQGLIIRLRNAKAFIYEITKEQQGNIPKVLPPLANVNGN